MTIAEEPQGLAHQQGRVTIIIGQGHLITIIIGTDALLRGRKRRKNCHMELDR
jgi:hypothetical protein